MSVAEQTPISAVTANGVTTLFPFGWKVLLASDLVVEVDGLTKTLNVDYSVAGVGADVGGSITFLLSAPVNGAQVIIYRDTSTSRATDYQQNGDFLSPVVNADFDRIWLRLQELVEELARAAVVPRGSTAPLLPSAEIGRFLRWRSDLLGLENADVGTLGAVGIPVSIAQGGTGASNQSTAIQNLGFIDVKAETTLTSGGALNSTHLGKAFVLADSGAPANYTITLPSGAPVGSLMMFRVDVNATKLYTLAGSDVGIDGVANRVLWRGESCLLERVSGLWTKIGGRTIPFRGCLKRTAAQSGVVAATFTPVAMQDEVGDLYNLDLCYDTVNSRFKAPRQGSWVFCGALSIVATVTLAIADADIALGNNSTISTSPPASLIRLPYAIGAARVSLYTGGVYSMNAGDFMNLLGRLSAGSGGTATTISFELLNNVLEPTLSYAEVPLW